jgi:hypothetical protein
MRSVVARARAGLEARRPVRSLRRLAAWEHESSARGVDLRRRRGPSALALGEPRAREVAVLAGLGLVEDGAIAGGNERLGALVVAREGHLGHEQARFERSPRIL